ncbi:hypothetical protein AGRA3207_003278 [Actinomadura graeca]|uniref:Uncharacterized protein n=1 Tax=Actinomadura graeca TaxID=2750812 RepID=A0ABX8QTZ5_9ACTN|nr:hypothetical protein [Actinomadura graeca]QXJ22296.1 hypothetical protein AGRA3207_003278 [Actinomadura graeca]
MRPADDAGGRPAARRLLDLADRAAAERTPAWLGLERRYREWELAEPAEIAARILRSGRPGAQPRVHRALVPSPAGCDRRSPAVAPGAVIRLLLYCAVSDDLQDLAGTRLGDVAVIEPVAQLHCYAEDFLDGDDPFAVLGGVAG